LGATEPAIGLGVAVSVSLRVLLPASSARRSLFSSVQEYTVAAVCDICAKGPGFGHNVSHSHRRTKRRFDPNIQRVRAVVNGSPKRLNVCTSCLKAGKVTR
jgi:large subunit ribosomal protein L28